MFLKLDSATKLDANYLQMYALSRRRFPFKLHRQLRYFVFFLALPGNVEVHTREGGGLQRTRPSFLFCTLFNLNQVCAMETGSRFTVFWLFFFFFESAALLFQPSPRPIIHLAHTCSSFGRPMRCLPFSKKGISFLELSY